MTTGATLFVMMDLALLMRMLSDCSECLSSAMLLPWWSACCVSGAAWDVALALTPVICTELQWISIVIKVNSRHVSCYSLGYFPNSFDEKVQMEFVLNGETTKIQFSFTATYAETHNKVGYKTLTNERVVGIFSLWKHVNSTKKNVQNTYAQHLCYLIIKQTAYGLTSVPRVLTSLGFCISASESSRLFICKSSHNKLALLLSAVSLKHKSLLFQLNYPTTEVILLFSAQSRLMSLWLPS